MARRVLATHTNVILFNWLKSVFFTVPTYTIGFTDQKLARSTRDVIWLAFPREASAAGVRGPRPLRGIEQGIILLLMNTQMSRARKEGIKVPIKACHEIVTTEKLMSKPEEEGHEGMSKFHAV